MVFPRLPAAFSRMRNYDVLKCPGVPCQEDNWSCGLRACMYMRCLLQKGIGVFCSGGWLTPIEGFVISDKVVNDQAVEDYCSGWTERTGSPPVKAEDEIPLFPSCQSVRVLPTPARSLRAKLESQVALPSAKPLPAATVASPLQNEPAPSASLAPTPVPLPAAVPSVSEKEPDASPPSVTSAGSPTPVPLLAAVPSVSEKEPDASPDTVTPEGLDQQIAALLAQRPEAKTRKQDAKIAKRILAEANFTFNNDFQKSHNMRPQKGHWEHFLKAVLASYHKTSTQDGLECLVCRKLLQVFDIPSVAERFRSKENALAPAPVAAMPEHGMDMVVYDDEAAEALHPNKRPRRGRPRKSEEVSFNLLEFIAAERAGQYEFLTREQAGRRQSFIYIVTIRHRMSLDVIGLFSHFDALRFLNYFDLFVKFRFY